MLLLSSTGTNVKAKFISVDWEKTKICNVLSFFIVNGQLPVVILPDQFHENRCPSFWVYDFWGGTGNFMAISCKNAWLVPTINTRASTRLAFLFPSLSSTLNQMSWRCDWHLIMAKQKILSSHENCVALMHQILYNHLSFLKVRIRGSRTLNLTPVAYRSFSYISTTKHVDIVI